MIIKKAVVKGFGKLTDRHFDFGEGLNVVYGENEAGKSTLHKFFEAMFFGVYNPANKNRQTLVKFINCDPWYGAAYGGLIQYTYKGKDYILQRSFAKNKEDVKLYDALTGENLTELLVYDTAAKLPRANLHMDISASLFRNTVSISQASGASGAELAKETKELLLNTGSTFDSEISYKAVTDALEEERKLIGTAGQSKTPHGASAIKLKKLREEEERTRKVMENCREEYARINQSETGLLKSEEHKKALLSQNEQARLKNRLLDYTRCEALKQQINDLNSRLQNPSALSEKDYENFGRASALFEECIRDIKDEAAQAEKISGEIALLKEETDESEEQNAAEKAEEKYKDRAVYENTLERLEEIRENIAEKGLTQNSGETNKLAKKEKLFSLTGTACLIVAAASFLTGYLFDTVFYYVGAALAAVGITALLLWARTATKRADSEESNFDTELNRLESAEELCLSDIDKLINKYGCADEEQLAAFLSEAQKLTEQKQSKLEYLNRALEESETRSIQLKTEKETLSKQITDILTSVGAENAEQLKELIKESRADEAIRAQLSAKEDEIRNILKTSSLGALKAEAEKALKCGITVTSEAEPIPEEEIAEAEREISLLKEEISRLKGKLAEAEANIIPLNKLTEQIAAEEESLKKYEKKLEAITLAQQVIGGISREMRTDFAEELNSYVSEMTAQITGGKYCEVMVDDDMNISVSDAEGARVTSLAQLSSGTADQLYLALRFAVADLLIEDRTVPLFFDDCFLKYDENRLANALRFLAAASRKRQMILFTCRNAEREILTRENIPFNYIELKG